MATSWAVGAASTLGLAVVVLSSGFLVVGSTAAPFALFAGVFAAVAVGAWAYAISMGAHGGKGAVAALLMDAIVAAALGTYALSTCTTSACRDSPSRIFDVALVVVALLSAWACGAELRRRRGVVQWGTVIELALPVLLYALFWAFETLPLSR